MIKKILIAIAVLIGLALVAIVVVPHFVDWNRYLKASITAAAKDATGRDFTIEGDIGLTILPSPTFSAAKVHFANGPGGSAADMATLDSLDLRVALFPLLSGVVKVESVTLVGPKIILETLKDGTPNWQFVPPPAGVASGSTTAGGGTGGKPQAFQLDRLAIERGTLIYRDASGAAQTVEDLAATISAGSTTGPFLASGSAKVRGTPVKFDISTGALTGSAPAPVGIAVALADADAKLAFNGTVSLAASIPTVTGQLKSEGSDLGRLIVTLVPAMKGGLPPTLAQPFTIAGDIALDNPSASIKNIVLQLGDAKATGQLLIGVGPPLAADLTLALNRIDLDKLVGAPPAAASAAAGPPAEPAATGSASSGAAFSLPDNVDVKVTLTADAITYRGGIIGNTRLEAALAKGVLDITRVSADLPGSSSVAMTGRVTATNGVPGFAGTLKTRSDNLRGVLEWLKLPPPPVPPDRLRKVSLTAKLAATPESLQASDIDLRFDASTVTGGVVVSLPQAGKRTRPGYGVGLAIDQINLDGYRQPSAEPAAGATAATGGGGTKQAGLPLDGLKPLADYDANVELRIASLTANGQIAKGVHLAATLSNGTLTVKDASVTDFAGGRGAVSGTVSDLAGKPRFDTQLDVSASDGAKALQFAGMAKAPAAIGALKVGGKLAGGGQDVSYDLTFSLAGIGAQGQAKGKVAGIGAGVPRIDSTFQVAANDAGPLLVLAGLPGAAKLGALNVSGTAASGADDLTYNVVLALPGIGGKGTLDGKLTKLSATPQVDTKLDLRAETPGALLTMAGLTGGIVGKTGPLGVAGTLRGGADKMALDLKLIGLGGTAAIKGDVAAVQAAPSFALDIAANHPDLRQLLAAVSGGAPAGGPSGAFKLSTQATGSTRQASLANLVIEAGPSRLTGKIDYDGSTSRPKINADLQAGTLDLAALGAGGGSGSGGGGTGAGGGSDAGGGHWSRQRMNLTALDSLDANFSLVADALIAGGTRIDKAQIKGSLQAGKLTLSRFSGGVYGGTVEANGELASRGTASLNATLKATNILVEQAMNADYLGTKFGGPVSVNASVAATGNSQQEWIESLNGKGTLAGSIKLLTRVEQQVGVALLGALGQKVKVRGVTDVISGIYGDLAGSVNTLSGDFVIQRGLLETKNISFGNDRIRTLTHGTANLPPYTMNMAVDLFRGGKDPIATATLTGPIDKPNVGWSGSVLTGAAGAAAGGLTSPAAVGDVLQKVAPGLAGKLGGVGAAPAAAGGAPGAAGLTPPPAASDVTAPAGQAGAAPAAGQAQPAPNNKKKTKNKSKLDQVLPQILGQ